MKFGLLVDFRNPPWSTKSDAQVYSETLETVEMAEELGYDDIWVSEHHFAADGYCSAPLAVAAAIAARTRKVTIGQAVFLLPLYEPLRVAEDGAAIDLLSNGRFLFGPALGYRNEEFEGFRLDRSMRVGRFEESLEIIKQAWTQEAVNFHGKHFTIVETPVRPYPVQRPRPPIWIGALSKPAVHRAALLGDGLIAGGRKAYKWYMESREELGIEGTPEVAGTPRWHFVHEDPAWLRSEVSASLLEFHNTIVGYFRSAGQQMAMGDVVGTSVEDLEENAKYAFQTPDQCIEELTAYLADVPLTRFYTLAGLPGLPVEISRQWITTFATEVMPRLKTNLSKG